MTSETDFDSLHQQQSGYVYALASRLSGNPHDADDVYQETWLRIYRFLPGYKGGSLKSWVRTITINVFRSRWQRAQRELPQDDLVEQLADQPQPHANNRDLEQALAQLSQDMREVMVLRVLEDLSYQEIADLLGVPIGTVRSRLARARSSLLQITGGSL